MVISYYTKKEKKKEKVDRDVNVFQRILENKVGNEKVADVWSASRALEQCRNLFDCVHDTVDGMIKLFMELGYSNSEPKQLFEVGGYRLCIKNELKDNMLLPYYIE